MTTQESIEMQISFLETLYRKLIRQTARCDQMLKGDYADQQLRQVCSNIDAIVDQYITEANKLLSEFDDEHGVFELDDELFEKSDTEKSVEQKLNAVLAYAERYDYEELTKNHRRHRLPSAFSRSCDDSKGKRPGYFQPEPSPLVFSSQPTTNLAATPVSQLTLSMTRAGYKS